VFPPDAEPKEEIMNYDLERAAALAAGEKLKAFHRIEMELLRSHSAKMGRSKQHSCDARSAEETLRKMVDKFKRQYGQKELDKLYLFYGVR
jgi:hypothetical protein